MFCFPPPRIYSNLSVISFTCICSSCLSFTMSLSLWSKESHPGAFSALAFVVVVVSAFFSFPPHLLPPHFHSSVLPSPLLVPYTQQHRETAEEIKTHLCSYAALGKDMHLCTWEKWESALVLVGRWYESCTLCGLITPHCIHSF